MNKHSTKLPAGFRFAGVHCGIKTASDIEDVSLIAADSPCVAAGVYTKNQVVAAPVVLDRELTPSANIRAVITNSGNANACTGEEGMRNAKQMVACTAEAINASVDQVLVMSTGIIGEQLPMESARQGIEVAAKQLADSESSFEAAARGIMTTDTKMKVAHRTAGDSQISGFAKGSGMIGPNMATMLAVIMTDAALDSATAQQLLSKFVDESFNSINVDGHTSTNDTVLLLASGKAGAIPQDSMPEFERQLQQVCIDLAKQIVIDGEGATHLVEIVISGAQSDADARVIAEAIANSPLVKTAFAGNDPNWGRIVSAAGYAGPPMDITNTQLTLNGTKLFIAGCPADFDAEAAASSMKENRDILVELQVGTGQGTSRFWTCDLTHEYVTINAEYHT